MSNNKAVNFLRKNVYYFVFILSLALLSIITVALVATNENSSSGSSNDSVIDKPNDSANSGNEQETPGENLNPPVEEDNTPTVTVIVFEMPVNGTILKEYVGASVVYNQT